MGHWLPRPDRIVMSASPPKADMKANAERILLILVREEPYVVRQGRSDFNHDAIG
jgi:hypothetical protein